MKEELSPKVDRRFEPATEFSAKTRLDSFRNGVKEYQKKHPEVLGATVYGSMIKGDQAKETSDIDAFLYIDAENIKGEDSSKDPEYLESSYRSDFLKSLNVSENDTSKYYHDLRTKILSSEILDKEINARIEYGHKYSEYRKMLNENYQDASEEKRIELLTKEPPTRLISFPITGMFHARVGTGIDKYRHIFLEKLSALTDKEMAEAIWDDVNFGLKTYESKNDLNQTMRQPATLEDAMRIYHPLLHKDLVKEKEGKAVEDLTQKIKGLY